MVVCSDTLLKVAMSKKYKKIMIWSFFLKIFIFSEAVKIVEFWEKKLFDFRKKTNKNVYSLRNISKSLWIFTSFS